MKQKSFTHVITIGTVFFLLSLYSCFNLPSYRASETLIVYDQVKNNYLVKWSKTTVARSQVDKRYRHFDLEMRKTDFSNDNLSLTISSSFLIMEPDYLPEAYYLWKKNNVKVDFIEVKTLEYLENQNTISTATTTRTDVRTDNTSTTEPAKTAEKEAKTVTESATTSTTNVTTDTDVQSEILNKVSSIRKIQVTAEIIKEMIQLSKTNTSKNYEYFYIRLYATNYDFWDIPLNDNDLITLEEFFTGRKKTRR